MRHLTQNLYRRSLWKNGGGETVEIAVEPVAATLEDFDWRISMAKVAISGPFSHFPGIDRTLCVLGEGAMDLEFSGRGSIRLDADSPPYHFPADLDVTGKLAGPAITDLNVMTRRGRFRHHVSRLDLTARLALIPLWDALLIFAPAPLNVMCGGVKHALAADDSALADAADGIIHLEAIARTSVFIIDLASVSSQGGVKKSANGTG